MATSPTTAQLLIASAFEVLGSVYQPGETLTPADAQRGLRWLNLLVNTWTTQTLTVSATERQIFNLVAGRVDYTIGPGGDFALPSRPTRDALTGVGLLLNGALGVPQPVEISRTLLTDDAYQAISIKDLPNALFTAIRYNASYALGQGVVTLWPVPSTADHQIVLYLDAPLREFATLTTQYYLPEGCAEALIYNLATRLAPGNGVAVTPELAEMARTGLGDFKRSNAELSELPSDYPTDPTHGGYNINTGV